MEQSSCSRVPQQSYGTSYFDRPLTDVRIITMKVDNLKAIPLIP